MHTGLIYVLQELLLLPDTILFLESAGESELGKTDSEAGDEGHIKDAEHGDGGSDGGGNVHIGGEGYKDRYAHTSKHTHILSFSLSLFFSLSLSLSFPLSESHTHAHTHIRTRTHTRAHTHTDTHTHTHARENEAHIGRATGGTRTSMHA